MDQDQERAASASVLYPPRQWRDSIDIALRERHTVQIYHALSPVVLFTDDLRFQAGCLEREFYFGSTSASDYVTRIANFIHFIHSRRTFLQEKFVNDFSLMVLKQFNYESADLAIPLHFPPSPQEYEPPSVIRPLLRHRGNL